MINFLPYFSESSRMSCTSLEGELPPLLRWMGSGFNVVGAGSVLI